MNYPTYNLMTVKDNQKSELLRWVFVVVLTRGESDLQPVQMFMVLIYQQPFIFMVFTSSNKKDYNKVGQGELSSVVRRGQSLFALVCANTALFSCYSV